MGAPTLTYSVNLNGKSIEMGSSNTRASYSEGFNTINVTYSSDISLNYHCCMVTKADEEYGINKGVEVFKDFGGISANENHSYSFLINSTNFNKGDGVYRVSFYSREAATQIWDVTYLLLTTESNGEHKIYAPTNYDGIELYYQGIVPAA